MNGGRSSAAMRMAISALTSHARMRTLRNKINNAGRKHSPSCRISTIDDFRRRSQLSHQRRTHRAGQPAARLCAILTTNQRPKAPAGRLNIRRARSTSFSGALKRSGKHHTGDAPLNKSASIFAIAVVVASSLTFSPRANAGCFQQYQRDIEDCANLSSWVDRSACGLDAATQLAGCVRQTVMG